MTDRIMTEREACIHLGVSRSTLAGWRMRKVGPPYYCYLGTAIRYRQSELDAWQAGQHNAA